MITELLLNEIDTVISGRRLLDHPFYQQWIAGELTLDQLRAYACQYYKFEAAFPGYLCKVLAKLDTADDRRVLLQNLVDEEGGPETHLQMFTRFGHALGLTREELQDSPVSPSTRALLDTFAEATAAGSAAEGLVALYAYESQAAEVAATKSDSLGRLYGIDSKDGTDFWAVHAEADVLHGTWERELLERLVDQPEPVISACRRASDALWGFLDGFPLAAA